MSNFIRVFILSLCILFNPLTSHATLYDYLGVGTITTTDNTTLNFAIQCQIDSFLHDPNSANYSPIVSYPDAALIYGQLPIQNGSILVDGHGLYGQVSGAVGGWLVAQDSSNPSAGYNAMLSDSTGLSSPDGLTFNAGSIAAVQFLNYDGSPYSGSSSTKVYDPLSLEYGMCAPSMTISGNGWYIALQDQIYYNATLNMTLARQSPVPEPSSMILFGIGLIGFTGLRLRKKK